MSPMTFQHAPVSGTVAGVAEMSEYEWTVDYEHSFLAVGACVTVVRGLDVASTVAAFGGDPSIPPRPLASVFEQGFYMDIAAVAAVGDVVVAVEPNGFAGSRPEVLRRASGNGAAVSVFWNVNDDTCFSYAVAGAVVTSFDLSASDYRYGTDPDRLLPQMEGLSFEYGIRIPAGFALAERVIGRGLTRQEVEGITDAWDLVPFLPDLYPRLAEHHFLRYDEPELVDLVAGATPEVLREVAALAAERAASAAGLDGEPDIGEALARLRSAPGTPLSPAVAEVVRRLLHRSSVAHGALNNPAVDSRRAMADAREASRPANAGMALYQATNPDPLSAALDALSSARHVAGEGLLEEARAVCAG